jgi:hypothetical protein
MPGEQAQDLRDPRSRPGWLRFRWLWAGTLVVVLAVAGLVAALVVAAPSPSARDQRWRRDIAYLASQLPQVRADVLGTVPPSAWNAAARRLESRVPRLSNGQIVVGMARLVAMLHDDETQVNLPGQPIYPLQAQFFGSGLYLLAVPPAERSLLGARLLAVNGLPIRQVLARIRPVMDAQDAQLLIDEELGALDEAYLLHWLGITKSATTAKFTVRTVTGRQQTVRLTATGSADLVFAEFLTLPAGLAHVPLPLYQQHAGSPYWMQVLPAQRAVYLKYNQCLTTDGFQQLAARALAVLRANPGYRLVVDLRGNGGGNSAPFNSLIAGLRADPAINRRGRVFGLVDHFTASSATVDANNLAQETNAILIGQDPSDPIDEWGDDQFFRLPQSQITVGYTTAIINPNQVRLGIPDIMVSPTLRQVLAGDDPVLARALSYGQAGLAK